MHLTNYAINKENDQFQANTDEDRDDVGSKRSMTSIFDRIEEEYGLEKAMEVHQGIKDIIVKTLCVA
jgi:tubulin polyglutamylase TTLL6/13